MKYDLLSTVDIRRLLQTGNMLVLVKKKIISKSNFLIPDSAED